MTIFRLKYAPIIAMAFLFSSCIGDQIISDALHDPLKVTKLRVVNKSLKELPKDIAKFRNLKVLYIMRTGIDSLPPEIGQLVNLEKLILSSNHLKYLPQEIGYLKNLKMLSIRNNGLRDLPYSIGELTNLKELYLDGNRLQYLPDEIGLLKKVEVMTIGENRLLYLPKSIGQMESMRFLSVGKNSLTFLPNELFNLTKLNELNLAFSGPALRVNDALGNLVNLDKLYIDRATVLPYTVNNLRNRVQIIYRQRGDPYLRW